MPNFLKGSRARNTASRFMAKSPISVSIKSFNAAKAKAVPGVRAVVQIDTGVAVVADNFWSAHQARDVLEVVWDEGPLAKLSTPGLREEYKKLAGTQGAVARKEGDPEKAMKAAAKRIEAEYEVPYLAHATMETLNCLVDLRADRCEINSTPGPAHGQGRRCPGGGTQA